MKFKLKATPKDWLIFAIFAIILLYIVAIAVLNINSFAVYGFFYGLNPIEAFTSEFLPATIIFYIFALIFLFVSVKSYFFDKEKGFGISFGEKEKKGYERFTTEKEIKQDLKEVVIKDEEYQYAGFPIVNDGKKMWVDNGESHNLVIGSTGTGKTQCIIHPLVKILAKKGESMIVTDPKGEIYRESAGLLKEKGYKIVILNFRDPQRGNTWNPLTLPYSLYKNGNSDKAMELLDDLAANILYEENSKDPFWSQTSADYFTGLTLGLFDDGKPEEININSISLMATLGEEKSGPRSTYIKDYFGDKDPASSAYVSASGTVFAPEETKGSILSTFRQKIRVFASRENLSEMLATSDFDMASIGKEKTAVFMIIQDEKKTYHALATIFIKQCYESLIDVAQNSPKGELPVRTNFILDEFANMPPLKDVTTMITAARSRLIRFTMIIQNFAQLDAVYGKENAQTIRSNCNNMLYLLTTELAALKEISELCGEKKVKEGKGDKEKEVTRPLITVAELQQMKQFECIVKRIRFGPLKTKLVPNFKIDWGKTYGEADPFVQREKQPIATFNLVEFVKAKKEQKFKNMMDNTPDMGGGMNPFMGPNPFASQRMENPLNQMNPNMFGNPFATPDGGKIDVDDLVKRIDAKIAELEAEEKQKEELSQKENLVKQPEHEAKQEENSVVEEPKIAELQPVMDNTNDNVTDIYNNTKNIKATEDQFFDDFFDE